MSGGFAFPPPPPPPPKPTKLTPDHYGQHNQSNAGLQNHRGGVGNQAGPYGQGRASGRGYSNSNAGHQQRPPCSSFQDGISPGTSSGPASNYGPRPQFSTLPSELHVNPNLSSSQFRRRVTQDNICPTRTGAGHKRKLDALRPPNDKTRKPGPPAAPAIPSFGAVVVQSKPIPKVKSSATAHENAEGRAPGRSLGLIPVANGAAMACSDSEEDDLDEETLYAELGSKLTFEHNGVVMSLNSQADLVAWKKARQRNWPTKIRMAEKDEERRRIGGERKRLLTTAASVQSSTQSMSKRQNKAADIPSPLVGLDERAIRLSELRKKVMDSEAKNREAKGRGHPGQNSSISSDRLSGCLSEPLATPSAVMEPANPMEVGVGAKETLRTGASEDSLADLLSENSSSSTSDSDIHLDNEQPEEVSSKPPDVQDPVGDQPVCQHLAASGHCMLGNSCQLKDKSPADSKSGPRQFRQRSRLPPLPSQSQARSSTERKGIFQLLQEQEQEGQNRLALKVVKYLGKRGLFDESVSTEAQ